MAYPYDPAQRPGASLFGQLMVQQPEALPSATNFGQLMVPPEAPPSLVQVPEPPRGILGRIGSALQNPRLSQQLLSMGTEMLANSGYQAMPVTTGAGIGRGLQAFGQAGQRYDQMIGQQAADAFNKRAKELEMTKTQAEVDKLNREAAGGGAFQGTSMDAQIANILLDPNADPASPQWQFAYKQYTAPKMIFDEATGKLIQVEPPRVPYIEQRASSVGAPPVGQPTEQVPQGQVPQGPSVKVQQVTEGAETRKLRQQNEQDTKDKTWQLREQYEKAKASISDYSSKLSQAEALLNSKQSGVADIALINTFQKLVDEGAVVRDQDVELLSSTGGAYGSLQQAVSGLQSGQKLPPQVRQQMLEALRVMRGEFEKRSGNLANDYRARAKDFELDPERVAPMAKPGGGAKDLSKFDRRR